MNFIYLQRLKKCILISFEGFLISFEILNCREFEKWLKNDVGGTSGKTISKYGGS